MPLSRPPGAAGRTRRVKRGMIGVAVIAAAVVLGGCGGAGHSAGTSPSVAVCGTAKTAANVPVTVEVMKGQVSCGTAVEVEKAYTRAIEAAIRSGKFGNGGGAPIGVRGWTCQGYPTPTVDKTGKTSRCVNGNSEIVAVLQLSGTAG